MYKGTTRIIHCILTICTPYTHVLLKPEYVSEMLFCNALIAVVNSRDSTCFCKEINPWVGLVCVCGWLVSIDCVSIYSEYNTNGACEQLFLYTYTLTNTDVACEQLLLYTLTNSKGIYEQLFLCMLTNTSAVCEQLFLYTPNNIDIACEQLFLYTLINIDIAVEPLFLYILTNTGGAC